MVYGAPLEGLFDPVQNQFTLLKFIKSIVEMNIDTKVNHHKHDQIHHQRCFELVAEVNVCIAEMKSSLLGHVVETYDPAAQGC